ncbi:MAG: hypothetical protein DRQ24_10675 [Candidatus Latescibacterota bacterium]|nr:MAG: hypothetical protein DRQ24_10675 [Candidatus Latescibacterota bacterium]
MSKKFFFIFSSFYLFIFLSFHLSIFSSFQLFIFLSFYFSPGFFLYNGDMSRNLLTIPGVTSIILSISS